MTHRCVISPTQKGHDNASLHRLSIVYEYLYIYDVKWIYALSETLSATLNITYGTVSAIIGRCGSIATTTLRK